MKVTIDATDLINKLNILKLNSNDALPVVTNAMANSTMEVSKRKIEPNNNTGGLYNSHKVTSLVYNSLALSYLSVGEGTTNQRGEPYIGYFYWGTSGSWVIKNVPSANVIAKYPDNYFIPDKSNPSIWYMSGQDSHKFLEEAFTDTLRSNLSLASSLYKTYLIRGI